MGKVNENNNKTTLQTFNQPSSYLVDICNEPAILMQYTVGVISITYTWPDWTYNVCLFLHGELFWCLRVRRFHSLKRWSPSRKL